MGLIQGQEEIKEILYVCYVHQHVVHLHAALLSVVQNQTAKCLCGKRFELSRNVILANILIYMVVKILAHEQACVQTS